MKLRAAAAVFYGAVGVLGLGDFAGNVATLADASRMAEAADYLGIGTEAERIRLTFLLPLSGLIAFLALSVCLGALLQEYRWSRRILVTALLGLYAAFQLVTAIVNNLWVGAFALLFTVLALISYWFVRSTSPALRSDAL